MKSFASLVLSVFIIFFSSQAIAAPQPLKELEEIREEISLLNLLRGLYLSKEQAKKIFEVTKKAQEIRENSIKMFEADKAGILSTFEHLRDALYEPIGKEKEAQGKAQTLNERLKEAHGKLQDKIAELEDEVEEILSSAQASIVEDFQPCLIPPKSLKDPLRVGQANDAGGKLAKVAELIFAAPDDVWKERGNYLLDRIAQELEEETGEATAGMKTSMRNQLSLIASKIRNCSEVDFNLKKKNLGDELLLINPKKVLKHGHKPTGKIAKWFLSPTAFKVLPQWIKTLENPQPAAVDIEYEDEFSENQKGQPMGEKVINMLKKLYRKRENVKGLPPLQSVLEPVKAAVEKKDIEKLLPAVLAALDPLLEMQPDAECVRLLDRIAHLTAKAVGLPLLKPNHDPYGFVADLKKFRQADFREGCKGIRALIDKISRFKKIKG